MRPKSGLRVLSVAVAVAFLVGGCSHLPTSNGNKGGNTAPVTLTFHDTPSNGVEVTSFEASVTGAVLQPGNISLLSAPQTIELTQLQANSAFLSTTKTVPAGTYTSLTITYANPIYTILNNSGGSLTIFGNTCAAGASCIVTPTGNTLTNTINTFLVGTPPAAGSLVIGTGQPTLLEVDVNLNDIIQSDFSVNFSQTGVSGAVTATQLQSSQTTNVIDALALSGTVTGNPAANAFSLTASTGQLFNNISVTSNTLFSQFNQTSRNSTCTAGDFTCLATGQVVDVQLQILGDGTFQAAEVDFDDAASTQQVSGTIVALGSTTPPTSFTMIVHNTVPALASLPAGTPVTVTIGTGATFDINEGTFVLPTGSFSFASATDFLVGQEVEARVSGSVTTGPPAAFTADRFALEQTQLTASVFNPNQGALSFFMNSLPPLFASPVIQIQVFTSSQNQTLFQTPNGSFTDLTSAMSPNNVFSVGGFLFNSGTSTPNLTAEVVRGPVTGP